MSKQMKISFYFLLFFLLEKANSLKCGEEEIENCLECGIDTNSNTCIKCQENHFLFFNDLYCLPCDDPIYGIQTCKGNCNITFYRNYNTLMCKENDCKEGYQNVEGKCKTCSDGLEGCKTCIIKPGSYAFYPSYKCSECISDEYKLNSDGKCKKCNVQFCEKCHFNFNEPECDECWEGYYLSDDHKECKRCKDYVNIENGYCTICSDDQTDFEKATCTCYNGYTLKDQFTCVECPDHCQYCIFSKTKNEIICKLCYEDSILNSENSCIYCGEGCTSCNLEEDSTPTCTKCDSGSILINGKSEKCPNNCEKCHSDEENKIICDECKYEYGLDSSGKCIKCSSINKEGMSECLKCGYNKTTNQLDCYECKTHNNGYGQIYYSAYIINTYQCLNNLDESNLDLYGCMEAYKNGDKYECLKCSNYTDYNNDKFIMPKNSKRCININDLRSELGPCEEAENIGTENEQVYSCLKCSELNKTKIYRNENKMI